MISYISNQGINRERWDRCISGSVNRRVYGFSWYLDQVCPGWGALVEDEYKRVMPLTGARKWGISYLYQPYFTQQLGIFSAESTEPPKIMEFLHSIPELFRFAEIHLNSSNDFHLEGYAIERRRNHELSLNRPYADIQSSYSQNALRNIKKSNDFGISCRKDAGVEDLISLFRDNFGKKEGKLKERHYKNAHGLLTYMKQAGMGQVYGAYSPEGQLHSAAFVMIDAHRIYFLFAASGNLARTSGAMFNLVDALIKSHSGSENVLDFEGGNDPGIGRFYKSFGANEVCYPVVRIDRLSTVSRFGFKMAKKIKNRKVAGKESNE